MNVLQWYAMRSHPHQEEALFRELQAREIEVFYPRLKVKPVNPRARKSRPYFPGYLFIHVDLSQFGTSYFQWLPYAACLVSFGDYTPIVPLNLIQALKNRLNALETSGSLTPGSFQPQQKVGIESGPFAGYEAIFDTNLPGSQRARVLLQMLNQQQVPLELDIRQIRPLKILKRDK